MAQDKVTYLIDGKNLLSQKLKEIDRDAANTDKSVNAIGRGGIGKPGGGGGNMLGSIVGGNLLAGGISSATGALKDFGMQAFQSYGKFEQFGVALTTMFHGNKVEAEQLSNQLVDFAKKTPFELTEIQGATKQLIAYGSTSGSVGKELKMLGDISSGVGAPLGEIAYLYGTARTQGRLFARDIYQLSGRGIPIVEALAKQFKVTKDKVMDLVSAGKVGFPEMQKALESMTKEGGQFAGMMDAQSKTLLGMTSNLGDAWEQLQVNIGKSQKGILSKTISWATDMVSNINIALSRQNKIDDVFSEHENKTGKNLHEGEGNPLFRFFTGKNEADKRNSKYNQYQDNLDLYTENLQTMEQAHLADKVFRRMSEKLAIAEKISNATGMNKDENEGKRALLTAAQKQIHDFKENYWNQKVGSYLKDKENGIGDIGDTSGTGTSGTGTTIESGTPKNLTINVYGGVGTGTVIENKNNLKLSSEEVGMKWLELINDAYTGMV